jgi:hypothetical protein
LELTMNVPTALGFAKQAALDAAGLLQRSRSSQLRGFKLDAIAGDLKRGRRFMDPASKARPSQNLSRVERVADKAHRRSLRDKGVADMMKEP